MTLKEILFGGGSALFVLLTLLQLAPIKINPWSAIAKAFGRAINSEVLEKVGKLESELQCVRSGMAEEKAVNCRARILRFGDECLHGERHTKDHFDQTDFIRKLNIPVFVGKCVCICRKSGKTGRFHRRAHPTAPGADGSAHWFGRAMAETIQGNSPFLPECFGRTSHNA